MSTEDARRRWLRPLLAVVAGLAALFVAFLALVITGAAGERGGWVWAPLILAAPTAITVGLVSGGHARRREAAVAVAIVAALLGLAMSRSAQFTHGRLWHDLDAFDIPAGMSRVAEHDNGNTLCLDSCPSVTRLFLARGTVETWTDRLRDAAVAEGFTMQQWRPAGLVPEQEARFAADGTRGRLALRVEVGVEPLTTYADDESTPVEVAVPPGSVGILISMET